MIHLEKNSFDLDDNISDLDILNQNILCRMTSHDLESDLNNFEVFSQRSTYLSLKYHQAKSLNKCKTFQTKLNERL